MPKLYTKTGDNGESSLFDGTRVSKTNKIFESLGNLDELIAQIGMVKAFWNEELESCCIKIYNAPGAGAMFYRTEPSIVPHGYFGPPLYYEWFTLNIKMTSIQRNLMNICSVIATDGAVQFDKELIDQIERDIDRLDSLTPPLTKFIVPSANKLCSSIHVCRAVTRRTERSCQNESDTVCIYMNRLSDYFFALSRFVAMTLGVCEDLN